MISSEEVITLIKGFPVTERLMIVEAILRDIRREKGTPEPPEASKEKEEKSGPAILSLAGILDEEEAAVFDKAVEESRKIDEDEW